MSDMICSDYNKQPHKSQRTYRLGVKQTMEQKILSLKGHSHEI